MSSPKGPGRPILLTGAHRSGTTWVGRMLALSPDVGYVHEPFNPRTNPGISSAQFDRYFHYVCAENEERWYPPLARTLALDYALGPQLAAVRSPRDLGRSVRDWMRFSAARRRGARPLMKDPIAVFSTEWLAERFGMDVVLLVRHPAAFASSLVRLDWRHRFEGFLEDPLLLRDHLGPFEAEIRDLVARPHDVVDEAILLWRMIYRTIRTFEERRPDWIVVRHEDLSRAPEGSYETLYGQVALEYTPEIRAEIRSFSSGPAEADSAHSVRLDSASVVDAWKRRLTAKQIERIREGVQDVSPLYYSDDEW